MFCSSRKLKLFGVVVNDVGHNNEIVLYADQVSWMSDRPLGLTNHPGQLSLAIPLCAGAMSTGQREVMLCGWGVKAYKLMACVWWQVKLRELL